MQNPVVIDRPPRIQPELPFEQIDIPSPPEKKDDGNTRLIQVGLPLVTIVGYIFVSMLGGGGRNPLLLIPMALSVVASTIFSLYSYIKEKQKEAEMTRAYHDRLIELSKDMHTYHDMQRRFYLYNYPDVAGTTTIIADARREAEKPDRTLRSNVRLWERRVSDDDFGAIRIGMGTLPSTVQYVLGDVTNFADAQVREAMKLASDSRFVSNIPVIINLRQPVEDKSKSKEDDEEAQVKENDSQRIPVTHALGVAGGQDAVYEFTRSMLGHFLTFHAPMDATLYLIASRRADWAWIETVPHAKANEKGQCWCFVNEINRDQEANPFKDEEGNELEQYLEAIRKVLAQRRLRLQEKEEDASGDDPRQPFLLFVVDMLQDAYDPNHDMRKVETDAALSILLEHGGDLGAAVIFLVPERSKVPSGCRAVIEIERSSPSSNQKQAHDSKLFFRYAEQGVNTFRYVGHADVIAASKMQELATKLSSLTVRQGAGANLTNAVPFLDFMGYKTVLELKHGAAHLWQESAKPEYANWLKVRLGKMAGNKPRTLVFSAKRDGVHGMVAGSTGAGKSELLISMIVAMATTYEPSVVNFVLVDYKGGGAFADFKDLPHCVDIITNLAAEGVTRMFTAIKAEMQRRQRLLTQSGVKNIVEYRKRGFHETLNPFPYLFIIIDEFAEMIADRSEYKGELESITRIGRSLGVSLILAAQRPSGITDQMRSNIKFRICLRVETPGESREMLRRSDAAYLPTGIPGRGYLQVGNEDIELIQVAYSGDTYIDPATISHDKVIWLNRGTNPQAAAQDQTPPELYKVIITNLHHLAREQGVPVQRAPWPGFLPRRLALTERLIAPEVTSSSVIPPTGSLIKAVTFEEYLKAGTLETILVGEPRLSEDITLNPSLNAWINGRNGWLKKLDWKEYALRPVVGLIDNPYEAQQLPLVVEFQRGHAVVFGASGWGKTSFMRSTILSLAATHSPEHVHMYVLDLGGRQLKTLEGLPHLGAVIIPDEEGYKERVEQLLREIDDQVEARKNLLSESGIPDIYSYNHANPATAQAAIVLMIDNFIEFVETFGGEEETDVETVMDKFIALARQAKPYGVHIIISAAALGDVPNQVYSLVTERFTMKLAEPTEYRAIVGSVEELPDIAGRGYTKIGTQALSFQVAVPLEATGDDDASQHEELKALIAMMTAEATKLNPKRLPVRVDSLPKSVLFKHLVARQHHLTLDAGFLPALRQEIDNLWQRNLTAQHAAWLKAVLGVISGNRPRELVFEAKRDGVHGMIAGGTGAGKSELLMTLIISLACNYDPSILNFVLVDYKGGGAFTPFIDLPHTVEMVTNLNKSAVQRMFTAITAEMQRRQKLNTDTNTKDIVDYRKNGYHLETNPDGTKNARYHGPYPHLFVIIDEYAEMISDSPDFRDQLESIARLGRAQGVNLLLASQRPTGVSDQMRANIKYRICLRVEGVDTSREMLRRGDAAFLPNGMPGRGYLQVGNDNIELIQVAYAGEDYEFDLNENGDKPKFFEALVTLIKQLYGTREKPPTPWPPALIQGLTLDTPLSPRYADMTYADLLTMQQRTKTLALNPFLRDWLGQNGAWQPINWDMTAMRAVVGMVDNPGEAQQAPLVVDFTKGHAVLFGASGWGKTTFLRSLITSLAGTHSPNEFHAHVLDLGGRNLEILKDLPHVGTVIIPDEPGYEEKVQQLWRELDLIVRERSHLFSQAKVTNLYEYNKQTTAPLPAILVAIDNIAEYLETFSKSSSKDDKSALVDAFVNLARQGKAYGIHFVITASRLNALSTKMYSLFTERYTLRLSDSGDYPAIVGSQIGDIDEIRGRGYTKVGRHALSFQVAMPPGTGQIDATTGAIRTDANQISQLGAVMQRHMKAGTYAAPLQIGALPNAHLYRNLFPTFRRETPAPDSDSVVEGLKQLMQVRWNQNATSDHANWLNVTLGMVAGNRPKTIYFAADKDGVHGMVAGGTGSGKSEMLMALIVGLVLNYSPQILNFVLVDYKGGGAFKPFDDLPHVIDTVTNLNKAAVERMFTAINAEIRRRQALNADTRTKDIIDYRKQGLHLEFLADGTPNPKYHGTYPHLFIIIDEYSEMFADNPEFLAVLDSITRVGRAQGVNLLLASQKPKGVSDQMQANIKMRLCLRVEDADTSRELLGRPEAAMLPSIPGRGYVKSGNTEIELIQVSYTGDKQPDDREPNVLWQGRPAHGIAGQDVPRLYDAVVQIAQELTGTTPVRKPWPKFLPRQFSLQSSLYNVTQEAWFSLEAQVSEWLNGEGRWHGVDWNTTAMHPTVLLTDDPDEARQERRALDLTRNHLAIFGDSGLGKTSLLRSIMVALAATHSPAEVQMYVIDLGGRNYRVLEQLPHMGAALYADDATFEERLGRLLDWLTTLVDQRQQLLSEANAATIYAYNAAHADAPLPAIFVAIDNIAVLSENYANTLELVLMPLVRRSLSMGVSFAVTGNIPNNMPMRLFNLFGERLTFKQSDPDKYLDIVGRGASGIEDLAGRGYIRTESKPMLFQAALPVGVFDAAGKDTLTDGAELERLTSMMQRFVSRHAKLRAVQLNRIATLPELVNLHEMLANAPQQTAITSVLGMASSLEPAVLDLKKMGPHFAIFGPPVSGKTTALYDWVLSLANRYSPEQVRFVLIDTQTNGKFFKYGGKRSLAELPHVVDTIAEAEQLNDFVPRLEQECAVLAQGQASRLFVLIDNFDDFNEEIERAKLGATFGGLVRRHGADGLHVIMAGMPDGGNSDIKRRILAGNYGIGLRTAGSLDALRVMRTPASVRDKELPLGRGFIVKAGQPTMIQLATPYMVQGQISALDDADAVEAHAIAALDYWVTQLIAKYPSVQATWSAPLPESATPETQTRDPKVQQMLDYLYRGMQHHVARLQHSSTNGHNGTSPEILDQLDQQIKAVQQQRAEATNLIASLLQKVRLLQPSDQVRDSDELTTLQQKYDETVQLIRTFMAEQQAKNKTQPDVTVLLNQISLPAADTRQADLSLLQQFALLTDAQRNDPEALRPLLAEIVAGEKAANDGLSIDLHRHTAQLMDVDSLLLELQTVFADKN